MEATSKTADALTSTPDGWQSVRLGDVAEVNRGQWDPAEGSPILYLDLTAVVAPGRLSPPKELTAEDAPSRARRRVQAGDVLVSTVRPYLRGFARVPQAPHNLIASTGFAVLTPRPEVDGSLIYHHVMAPSFVRHLEASMMGQAYPAVRPSDVVSCPILLPPLTEQRAIAAVLDSIDEAIERTESVIAATEHLRDALLHELLTRGVPGWHSEWKEAPGIGTIPANWEVVRLGDVLKSTTYGTNASLDGAGAIPVLRMNNLQNGQIDLSEVRRADLADTELDDLNLVPGDILFNRSNSLALVGKVAIVRDLPKPISFASYLVRLRVRELRANPFWLSTLLCFRSCQSRIRRFATPGVSQANINPTSLKSLMIPLPSLAEQRAVAAMLGSVNEATEQVHTERDALQSLKASTSDVLLTGRVRVRIA